MIPFQSEDKLVIDKTSYELNIQFRWFTPVAFFLAFFCIVWDGFLIFWYAMGSQSDAPIFFYVFPLLHVAVGLGLTYYTICLFMNKTYIKVGGGELDIRHAPVPWWRGNTQIAANEIEQLYVKEVKQNKKNGQYNYKLQARLHNGKHISILNIDQGDSGMMQRLEKEIEDFLQLEDEAIPGEFHKNRTAVTSSVPKARKTAPQIGHTPQLQHLRVGDFLTYEGHSYKLVHLSQYDWNNGDTDKLIQLLSDGEREQLLYLRQNKGIYQSFLETKLSLMEANDIFFLKKAPPTRLDYRGISYQLEEFMKGQLFRHKQSKGLEVDQWLYVSSEGKGHLRIQDNDGMSTMYIGVEENKDAFEDLLTGG